VRVPPAEVRIDEPLVRALLGAQHPELAALPLVEVPGGWDNAIWRLGDELAVRLPRREIGAVCARSEHAWLPELAPVVAAPLPTPVGLGEPGHGYPWPWSIVPWLTGDTAAVRPLGPEGVRALGRALFTLHVPAPSQAPVNPYRGVPLAEREDPLPALAALHGGTPPRPLGRVWARALEAEAIAPAAHRVWTHGDLHARNILVAADGGLAGVLDWGDVGAADPAVDLSLLWTVLDPAQHGLFCGGYGPVDGPLLARARGWALAFATIFAGLTDDPGAVAIGRRTLAQLQG
jgi:aminoglycoside phosphotransferase (APT) family kinase protein